MQTGFGTDRPSHGPRSRGCPGGLRGRRAGLPTERVRFHRGFPAELQRRGLASRRLAMKRGRPFEPGNKLGRGRPPGSRNKKTLIIQEILAKEDRRLREKIKAGRRRGEEARRCRGELDPPPSGPLAETRRLRFL